MVERIGGISINYEISGGGEPVIFLHGWGGSIAGFGGCAKFLSQSRLCVNLDLPPFGQSGAIEGVWGAGDYAALVAGLIDKLKLGRVSVVAHSFGGRIAVCLAAHYPDLVNKMVLTGAAGVRPRRGIKYKFRVWQYRRAKKKGADISRFGSADYRALPESMRPTFNKIVGENLSPLFRNVRVPVLLIWGDTDKETPPYMARKMRRGIPSCELVYLPGGHYAYIENHAEFCETVRFWLERG